MYIKAKALCLWLRARALDVKQVDFATICTQCCKTCAPVQYVSVFLLCSSSTCKLTSDTNNADVYRESILMCTLLCYCVDHLSSPSSHAVSLKSKWTISLSLPRLLRGYCIAEGSPCERRWQPLCAMDSRSACLLCKGT